MSEHASGIHRALICLGVVAAGHLVILAAAAFVEPRGLLWGIHAWTYLSPVTLVGVMLAAAGTFALVRRSPPFPGRFWTSAVIALALFPLFYLLHDQTHLLGDGRLWISVLAGPRAYHAHEPLAFAASALVTMGIQDAADVTHRLELFASGLGVAGFMAAALIAFRLGRGRTGRWFVLALISGSATVQFGFGYIEAYPLLWVAVALFLLGGLLVLEDRAPLFVPMTLYGVVTAIHGSGSLLLPAVVFLFWRKRSRWREGTLGLALGAVVSAAAYGFLPTLMPAAPGDSLDATRVLDGIRSLFGEIRFFSHGVEGWLLDQLNRWTLLTPLVPALIGLGLLTQDRETRGHPSPVFLGISGLALAAPILVLNPEGSRGAALDWDAFSVSALPLAAWAGAIWAPRMDAWPRLRSVAAIVAAVGLLGSGAYVLVNAAPRRAVERYQDVVEAATTWSPQTRAMALESLALYFRDHDEATLALEAYERAAASDPGNIRLGRNTASMQHQAGDHRAAADTYLRLVDRSPSDPTLWHRTGLALERVASRDSARAAYGEAIRRGSRNPETYNRLARLLLLDSPGFPEKAQARELIQRSLAIEPGQPAHTELREILDSLMEGAKPD